MSLADFEIIDRLGKSKPPERSPTVWPTELDSVFGAVKIAILLFAKETAKL